MNERRLTTGRFGTAVLVSIASFLTACAEREPEERVQTPVIPGQTVGILAAPSYLSKYVPGKCCTVIAHAGGAIDGNSYTNSIEAIQKNYSLGTRIFELDLDKTSDGHWVAAHDWPQWKGRTGFAGSIPPDLDTFASLKRKFPTVSWSIEAEYSPMTFTWLEDFLLDHPDASIVTDIKELDEFENLVDAVFSSPVRNQFIFQAYDIQQVDFVAERGPSARVILTLYRLGFPDGLFENLKARQERLVGVTVPMNWAFEPGRMDALRGTGIPIFLHGRPSNINSRALHADYAAKGVSGFYLD
jgi:hypothetical protein